MITFDNIRDLRQALAKARQDGKRIALVPTMGNLHAGHISLVKTANQHSDFIVVSIFVNPMQFGPDEDLDKYPRTLPADQACLLEAGCDLLYTPSVEEIYPNGMQHQTCVHVPIVSEGLCGGSRPGHFDGVATVVNKLLNIVSPDVAVFGEKDFQQLAVIRKMVRDLNIPVEIVGAPIVRAEDGLALSSRNGYLDERQREAAPQLHRTLQWVGEQLQSGELPVEAILEEAKRQCEAAGMRLDYLEVRDPLTLGPARTDDRQLIILAAAYLGNTRLIDNLTVDLH